MFLSQFLRYCECFQAGILCGEFCRCQECKNFDGSKERMILEAKGHAHPIQKLSTNNQAVTSNSNGVTTESDIVTTNAAVLNHGTQGSTSRHVMTTNQKIEDQLAGFGKLMSSL